VILSALFAALVAAISPFWGVLIILILGGRHINRPNGIRYYLIFTGTALVFLIANLNTIRLMNSLDMILGVGLSTALCFYLLRHKYTYINSLIIVTVYNSIYAYTRFLIFENTIVNLLSESMTQMREMWQNLLADRPELLQNFLELSEKSREIMLSNNIAIWVVTISLALYIGLLIFSRKVDVKWDHKRTRIPFYFVYILIIGLVLTLIPQSRLAGGNILVILSLLYLIQGIAMLDYFMGSFFRKHKLLMIVFIIIILINIYLLGLIILFGIVDNWLNLRKLSINGGDR